MANHQQCQLQGAVPLFEGAPVDGFIAAVGLYIFIADVININSCLSHFILHFSKVTNKY